MADLTPEWVAQRRVPRGYDAHLLPVYLDEALDQLEIQMKETSKLKAEWAARKTLAEDIAEQNDVIVLKKKVNDLRIKLSEEWAEHQSAIVVHNNRATEAENALETLKRVYVCEYCKRIHAAGTLHPPSGCRQAKTPCPACRCPWIKIGQDGRCPECGMSPYGGEWPGEGR